MYCVGLAMSSRHGLEALAPHAVQLGNLAELTIALGLWYESSYSCNDHPSWDELCGNSIARIRNREDSNKKNERQKDKNKNKKNRKSSLFPSAKA